MIVDTSFGSDNHAGVHPRILDAIREANSGPAVAYGLDDFTATAVEKFREHFGKNADVYLVFNGTGANVISLATLARPFQAVICTEHAHINADECGAPENYSGCKLKTVHTPNGKLTVDDIGRQLAGRLDQHRVQPSVVSITQASELGTVYSAEEVREIAAFCHGHNLYLHMDGARICNAAASLGKGLGEISGQLGVDMLSFGGTKNGLLLGEAVVCFNPELSKHTLFIRKQAMQLASKMRFIAAQFTALLSDDLWLQNASQANRMAKLLEEKVKGIPGLAIVQPVQANAVFASLPRQAIDKLLKKYFFYTWDEDKNEVRWMTSFSTTEKDIENFAAAIRESCK
ncbi:MAG: low specificity L-threonine aldolase [Candidatus Aminicenantes bacterium]|jgi:threonine aldolase|nr:low specificity L-threonine aldolase [Candidatus Aminicenantes bacterium]